MSLFVNDIQVYTGEIVLNLNGIWYADIRLYNKTNPFKVGDEVTITTQDNSISLTGNIAPYRTGDLLSMVYIRVIGGKKGKMSSIATPKAFQNGLVSDVLNTLMNDSQETLSSTISQEVLNTQLSNWTVFQSPINYQLNILAKAFDWNWRFLPDGTFWIGEETFPDINEVIEVEAGKDYVMLDYDIINKIVNYAVHIPFMLPGYTIDGYKSSQIIQELHEDKMRTKLYEPQATINRNIWSAINSLIDNRVAPIDFFAQYQATVKSQSSDLLKVDIQPDDARLPGMQSIEFSSNLGGTTIQISGGKVLLGWKSGDPLQPYCVMQAGQGENVQKMTLTSNEVNVGGAGGDNVATKADLTALITAIGSSLTSATGGAVSWVGTPPTATCSQIVKAKRT